MVGKEFYTEPNMRKIWLVIIIIIYFRDKEIFEYKVYSRQ